MKNLIVVLMGGISGERNISILSGKACSKALKKKGYNVVELDAKGNFVKELIRLKPKVVFNALHGRYGEDGFIQSILEALKIPYTHSGVLASSNAMDKYLSKLIFKKNKIRVPKYFLLDPSKNININKKMKKNKIKFPIVIKPVNEGSSLGVYICKNKIEFNKNYKVVSKKYNKILLEEYIPGREIQVAVMGSRSLGAIELVPKRKFYDYKAKYSNEAKTQHIMPAKVSSKKNIELLNIAKKAHKVLKCRGISRSDFRFYRNKFYLLEINTQPGMTKFSLVPEIAAYNNINFEELVSWMVKDASINR